jgi:hypothetical protein
MMRKEITIKTIEDVLTSEEIEDYHRRWNNFLSLEGNIPEDYGVVVKKPEHVVIGRVWQYRDLPVYRAKVLSDKLSWIPMDPPQPIWHEHHYWQVFEQIAQASRRKYFEQKGKRHIGKVKTPVTYTDLKQPINLGQRTFVELIPEIQIRETEKGILTIENHSCAFYNTENEVLGRHYVKAVGTLRDYEILFDELQRGEENAQERLISKIRNQERKLAEYGRSPKISLGELIRQIQNNLYNNSLYERLEDFFSLFDKNSEQNL